MPGLQIESELSDSEREYAEVLFEVWSIACYILPALQIHLSAGSAQNFLEFESTDKMIFDGV